jgi:hypothetical protein
MSARRRPPGFWLTLTASRPRDQVAALPIEQQAKLAHIVFGAVADRLTDCGIAPDLVATAATDLGHELLRLDGSPPRVFALDPRDLKRK